MIQLPSFEHLQTSDFWQFFNLQIGDKIPRDGQIFYRLKPGGFQHEIGLMIGTDVTGAIRAGILAMNRSWVTGPPYGVNPFALDITRSFIRSLIGEGEPGSRNFLQLFGDELVREYALAMPGSPAVNKDIPAFLDVYLGRNERAMKQFQGCNACLLNSAEQGIARFQVTIQAA